MAGQRVAKGASWGLSLSYANALMRGDKSRARQTLKALPIAMIMKRRSDLIGLIMIS